MTEILAVQQAMAQGARQRQRRWHYARAALTAALVAAVWLAVLLAAGPALLGFQSYVVASGSMAPAIPAGAAVIVEPVAADELHARDVIAFITERGVVVTHRIALALDAPGGRQFITKGDANPVVDPEPVHAANVLGRVWYSVPLAGQLVTVAGQSEVRLAALAGLLLLGGYRRWQGRRDRSAAA